MRVLGEQELPPSMELILLAASALVQTPGRRRIPARRTPATWVQRLSDPRRAVPLILLAVVVIGVGRRLRKAWRARALVGRLEVMDADLKDVEASSEYGRAALTELFRLQGTAKTQAVRDAAGHALAVLWARDELIAEEEKAIVRRGFQADWRARKRYPRALRAEVPIVVEYGVPFLRPDGQGVGPDNLSWSYRIEGARRVSLETLSPSTPGAGRAEFAVIPSDFATDGPHRLVLQARVKTVGLTESWELDLPHIPFSFEFDPLLKVDSLLALEDQTRAEVFARSIGLVNPQGGEPRFLAVNASLAIRGVPALELKTPLPCDLAHAVQIEFEGHEGWHLAGEAVVSGQGAFAETAPRLRNVPIGPMTGRTGPGLENPGAYRLRARLLANPERGWADPDVRSIWPGTIETDWIDVDVVRR